MWAPYLDRRHERELFALHRIDAQVAVLEASHKMRAVLAEGAGIAARVACVDQFEALARDLVGDGEGGARACARVCAVQCSAAVLVSSPYYLEVQRRF